MATKTSTRTSAPQAKLQAAEAIESTLPQTEEAEINYMDFMRSVAATAGIEIPSGKQMLISAIVGLGVALLGGYATGSIASYALAGALLYTGSAFIALCAYIITFIVGVYLSSKAAVWAVSYVGSSSIKNDYVAARGWVTSLFKSNVKVAPAVQS